MTDYDLLKATYKGTQILAEFTAFMHILNADWRKERELGAYAPEFCLYFIKQYESLVDDQAVDETFKSWLAKEYNEIRTRYEDFKSSYQSARLVNLHSEIDDEITSNISNDNLTEDEYNTLFESIRKRLDEQVYLDF